MTALQLNYQQINHDAMLLSVQHYYLILQENGWNVWITEWITWVLTTRVTNNSAETVRRRTLHY